MRGQPTQELPDGRMRNAEAIREEVLLSSFGLMFAEDSTEGHQDEIDYYKCKFASAFRTLRINHVRDEISRRRELTDLECTNEEGQPSYDDEMLGRLSRMGHVDGEDQVYLNQALLAVNDLPPDRLPSPCRILGYVQESSNRHRARAPSSAIASY
jgi:hypothetical protein